MNFVSFLRRFLKKYFPWLYNNSSFLRNFIYKSLFTKTISINVINEFQEFAPNVSGEEQMKSENTIYNIQNFSKSMSRIQNINFTMINTFIKKYNLNPKEITEDDLFNKKIFKRSKGNLKLLNIGQLENPTNLEVSFASKKAIEALEKLGGSIKIKKK